MFKEHLGCESCVQQSVLHHQALPQSCRRERERERPHVRPLLRGSIGGTRAPERQCISRKLTWAGGAQLLPAAVPVGLHPHAKEEGRSLLQRSPRDPTVISAPCLHNISPTSPIYPWAFSFSHPNLSLPRSLFCIPVPGAPYLMSWLYLARRSDLQGAPVFICKAFPKTNTVRDCYDLHQFPMAGQGILSSHPFAFLQACAWPGSHLPARCTVLQPDQQ